MNKIKLNLLTIGQVNAIMDKRKDYLEGQSNRIITEDAKKSIKQRLRYTMSKR